MKWLVVAVFVGGLLALITSDRIAIRGHMPIKGHTGFERPPPPDRFGRP